MRIACEQLLDVFRNADRCAVAECRRLTPWGADPMHLYAKGMGSGGRLDIPCNLVSGCRLCHTYNHNDRAPTRTMLIANVGLRYGVEPRVIEMEILRALNILKKGATYICPFTGFRWTKTDDFYLPNLRTLFPTASQRPAARP